MKNKKLDPSWIAILFLYLGANTGNIQPAMQAAIEAWPEVGVSTVRMLSTLHFLISTVTMFLIGAFVGQKLSFRTCINLGSIFLIIGALGPCIYCPDFNTVLMFRALLGVGIGLFSLKNGLLIKSIPPEKQARYIGLGYVVTSLHSVVNNTFSGIMVNQGWNKPLLFNLALIPFFIYIFFALREPEDSKNVNTTVKGPTDEEKINPKSFLLIFMICLMYFSAYPLLTGLSSFVISHNLGGSSTISTALSLYMLSGVAANLMLPTLKRLLKQFIVYAAVFCVLIGSALVLFCGNELLLYIGVILCGIGTMTNTSIFALYVGQINPPSKVALASNIYLGCTQLSVFLSNYFITVCDKLFSLPGDIDNSLLGCIIICGIILIAMFITKVIPKEN